MVLPSFCLSLFELETASGHFHRQFGIGHTVAIIGGPEHATIGFKAAGFEDMFYPGVGKRRVGIPDKSGCGCHYRRRERGAVHRYGRTVSIRYHDAFAGCCKGRGIAPVAEVCQGHAGIDGGDYVVIGGRGIGVEHRVIAGGEEDQSAFGVI